LQGYFSLPAAQHAGFAESVPGTPLALFNR
jgi:hypothetical protein